MSDDNADVRQMEHDIQDTQDQIGETVNKLEAQLNPKRLVQSLISGDDGQFGEWITMAKRNPMAAAMIGGGIVWLMSGKGDKASSKADRPEQHDPHHRSYLDHMSSVELRDGEEPAAYIQRRDAARGTYLMLERGDGEDDGGFRQRLDDATSTLRDRTSAFGDHAKDAASGFGRSLATTRGKVADAGKKALSGARDLYERSPLVGGLLAAAIGAGSGALLPVSQAESNKLGALGDQARSKLAEGKTALVDKAKDKTDAVAS